MHLFFFFLHVCIFHLFSPPGNTKHSISNVFEKPAFGQEGIKELKGFSLRLLCWFKNWKRRSVASKMSAAHQSLRLTASATLRLLLWRTIKSETSFCSQPCRKQISGRERSWQQEEFKEFMTIRRCDEASESCQPAEASAQLPWFQPAVTSLVRATDDTPSSPSNS